MEQGDLWAGGREIVATVWDAHAWLWHGNLTDFKPLREFNTTIIYTPSDPVETHPNFNPPR